MNKKSLVKIIFSIILMFVCFAYVKAEYDSFKCDSSVTNIRTCHYYDGHSTVNDGKNGNEYKCAMYLTEAYTMPGAGDYDPGFAICDKGEYVTAFCAQTSADFHNNVALTASNVTGSGIGCAISDYIANAANKESAISLLENANTQLFDSGFASLTSPISESNYTNKMKIQKQIWNYIGYTGTCSSKIEYKTTTSTSDTESTTKTAKITLNNTNLRISDDNKYYISDKITINTGGKAYTATLTPSSIGAVLCEDSKCEKLISLSGTINKTEVYIKIPSNKFSSTSSSTKLEISFTYTKNKTVTTTTHYYVSPTVTKYTTSAAQDMLTYRLTKTSTSDSTESSNNATVTANKTVSISNASISITKTDSKNKSKFVEGAVYKLYRKISDGRYIDAVHADGSEIDSDDLVTDEAGEIHISNLPYGNYKIEEKSAPTGYTISEDPVEFELDGNKTFDFTNTPRNIVLSKQDITKEGELKGAKICIYQYDTVNKKRGEEVKCYISGEEKGYENKPYEYYLSPGEYSLIETASPKGYEKLETEFVFEVTDNYEIELESAKSKNNIKVTDNKITIYNQPVEEPKVPDTGKTAKIIYSIIGTILVASGGTLIYLVKKKKKLIEQI